MNNFVVMEVDNMVVFDLLEKMVDVLYLMNLTLAEEDEVLGVYLTMKEFVEEYELYEFPE